MNSGGHVPASVVALQCAERASPQSDCLVWLFLITESAKFTSVSLSCVAPANWQTSPSAKSLLVLLNASARRFVPGHVILMVDGEGSTLLINFNAGKCLFTLNGSASKLFLLPGSRT